MLEQPPATPRMTKDKDLDAYLIDLDRWLSKIYKIVSLINLQDSSFTTSDGVPTGGNDGDLYIRKDGANTALYQNVNGVWGAL